MTETQTPDFDVTRATAIINVAMQGGMFPQGAMPESDTDKIVEAEKLYELARQADMVAQQIGKGNVPNYGVIEGVLFEAQTVDALVEAMRRLEDAADRFWPKALRAHAETFDRPRFRQRIAAFLDATLAGAARC